jgi:hypothetical protein
MSIKIDRAKHGPGWGEVILGAVLSAILGVALGAVLLVLRPVIAAPVMPKEADRVPNAVYYIEGSRDGGNGGRQALAKRKAFAEGQSVTVLETELNALASMPGTAAAKPEEKAKPADKAAPPPAASTQTVATGTMNFRLHDGALQVGVPVTVNALGVSPKFIVQTRGTFAKQGTVFVYEPREAYIGSCPVHRLPFVTGYLRGKFLESQSIPDDIRASWLKLANVSIEGNTLKLTMP